MLSEELAEIVSSRLRANIRRFPDLTVFPKLIGVIPRTFDKWVRDEQRPNGMTLVKLWHLLYESGIDSPELMALPEFNYILGELFTFGIISLSEASTICGDINESNALKVMRGGRSPTGAIMDVKELFNEYAGKLEIEVRAFAAARVRIPGNTVGSSVRMTDPVARVPTTKASFATLPPVTPPPVAKSTDDFIVQLASMLSGALPLVRFINSDECSGEQRARLRKLMGSDGMFDLSNNFSQLCSERARSTMRR